MRWIIRLCFWLFLIAAVLWSSGFYWFSQQIPRSPLQDTASTDGLIILTGGEKRIEEGIRLLAEGKANRLFISGVGKDVRLEDILHQLPSGLPPQVKPEQIELGYEALNTAGNADEANQWIRANQLQTVRVITANYHLPRAALEFSRIAPGVVVVMHPVFPDRMFMAGWWKDPQLLRLLAYEYHKYLWAIYRLNGFEGVYPFP